MLHFNFDNQFVHQLPGDTETSPHPRPVHGACWSPAQPTPVARPHLIAYADEVATLLDLAPTEIEADRDSFAEVFAGNRLLPGMQPYAACYGGHQFGHWAGQLGDGRAITLGETLNRRGERWDLQLKGAGPTPYARRADGRAVLRSSIREFLCSEAMHHLGVPTTRALALVGTGEPVLRDMLYDGNPRHEPGAVVCRVAPSFIRFGHFEIFTARGEHALLERLVDFTIARDYPEIDGDPKQKRARFFNEVCRRTAIMVAHWMRLGFVHGVMNTDNMSILGLTIDYGPYGWLDNYDPDWTPNTTDAEGRRYRYGHQPQIAHWNLQCLAQALAPLFPDAAPLEAGLEAYIAVFNEEFRQMLARKFGVEALAETDHAWVETIFHLLEAAEIDMTLFFRRLADIDPAQPTLAPLDIAFYSTELRARHSHALEAWLATYAARLRQEDLPQAERKQRMNAANPAFILRNYLAQQAIDRAEAGDFAGIASLQAALRQPYSALPEHRDFFGLRPDWARSRPGCAMLSCSS